MTKCSGCGRMRRAAARMPDGSARCQFCATRPVRTCSACGQQRTVAGTTDAGPGLRLVLPGSAAAVRALRPDSENRQAGDSIYP